MNLQISVMGYPLPKWKLAGFGLSPEEIAHVLEVDLDLLKSSCAREVESGRIKANLRVAESLYRKATGESRESVTAAIFGSRPARAGRKPVRPPPMFT